MIIKCDAKICTKCKKERPLTEFYNNRTHKSGKTFWCKECTNHRNNVLAKHVKAKWASTSYFRRKEKEPEHYLWKNARHRAQVAGMQFTIEQSDIVIPERCPYLGVVLDPKDKQLAPSLDRIDSSKGYVKGNIRVISFKANRMKSNATEAELVAFARGVLAVHAKEGICCADQM